MNKIELKLDKSKKYVVACSFGPDSMALLSLAYENGYQISVAHVNYRKRDVSLYEQQELERYCKERKIDFYVLDLLGEKHSGNFQEWAREKRYKFFKEVVEKEQAYAVLVAHQQDDVIETYLMQKNRGNIVKNPGISENIELFGVKIIRPLLAYSKAELKEFDDENHIPYSIDQSNLTDAYSRNKIRHHIVEKMSEGERRKIVEKISSQKEVDVELKTIWSKQEFLSLTYEATVKLLDHYMNKTKIHTDVSKKFFNEIQKAFRSKTNVAFELTDGLRLELDYGDVYLVNRTRLKDYLYRFEGQFKNEIFDIDFEGGAEDRNISKTESKFIVRNIPNNSKVIIKYYSQPINRLFIDWKVPHYLRKVWPGIYDEKGQLLYVPRYRKNFVDNHKSKFVFITKYFTEF